MLRLALVVVVVACGSDKGPNQPASKPTNVEDPGASVSSPPPTPTPPTPTPPTTPPATATSTAATVPTGPEDLGAAAADFYDPKGDNYVAPKLLAYAKKPQLVIYPACRGGEGPGESCDIAAMTHAGKGADLGVQIHWSTVAGRKQDRDPAVKSVEKLLRDTDAVRMWKQAWRGEPLELPGFGRLAWDDKARSIIATRDAATTNVAVTGKNTGPVAVYWSPSAPVAVALLRFNAASGGREGYVVSVEFVVIAKP